MPAFRAPAGRLLAVAALLLAFGHVAGAQDPTLLVVNKAEGTGEAGTHMVVATPDAATLFTSNIQSDSVSWFRKAAGVQAWDVTRVFGGQGAGGHRPVA